MASLEDGYQVCKDQQNISPVPAESDVNFKHAKTADDSGNICVLFQMHRAEFSSYSHTCF